MSAADDLKETMVALDRILTGKDEGAARHMARSQEHFFAEPSRFLESGGYYLSDGGYSRVFFHPEALEFRLDSVSRDAVKARWSEPEAQAAAARAGALLTRILTDLDGPTPSA